MIDIRRFDGKPPEVGVTDAREIRRGKCGAAVGGAHGQEFRSSVLMISAARMALN